MQSGGGALNKYCSPNDERRASYGALLSIISTLKRFLYSALVVNVVFSPRKHPNHLAHLQSYTSNQLTTTRYMDAIADEFQTSRDNLTHPPAATTPNTTTSSAFGSIAITHPALVNDNYHLPSSYYSADGGSQSYTHQFLPNPENFPRDDTCFHYQPKIAQSDRVKGETLPTSCACASWVPLLGDVEIETGSAVFMRYGILRVIHFHAVSH